MVNVRRGINIRVSFAVYRNGLPEDLSQAQIIRVVVSHKSLPNSSAVFTGSAVKVVGNSVSVVVSDIMQRTMTSGEHYIEVAYRLASPTAPDGYDPYVVDADVFNLVERSMDPNDIAIQTVNIPGEVSFSSQALDEILLEATGAVQAANEAAQNANDAADAAMAIVDSKVNIDGLNANVKRLQFDTTNPTAPMQIGQIAWDNDEHTLVTHDGLHTHPLGKELELRARNTSGATILNGRACYVTGSTGANPTIALATNTNGDIAQKTIGVATMDIANNAFGIVTTFGEVNGIDTSALTLGAIVYLGANGQLTTTEPIAPTPKIVIGLCVRQHAQVGKLFVSTRPIARLSKLSEVHAPVLTDNDVLRYNGTTLRWEVYSLAGKADLVGGKVPSAQLPAYVDDVLEYANLAAFPATGESGKIYVALNTNLTYRWSGTAYVEISKSLALGETADTAYRGDRGKTAYDHSQTTGNPHGTTAAQVSNTPAGSVAATTVQGAINELAGDIVQVETDLNEKSLKKIQTTTIGKNKFNKNNVTPDIYLKADGSEYKWSPGVYITSEYIPVNPNINYSLNYGARVVFYDINKNILSTYGSFIQPINSGINAKYARVCVQTQYLNTTQFEEGSFKTSYEVYKETYSYHIEPSIEGILVRNSDDLSMTFNKKYRYLLFTFGGSDARPDNLVILGSNNLTTYDLVSGRGAYTCKKTHYNATSLSQDINSMRDPAVIKIGIWYYITYTVIGWHNGSEIGMCRTTDFVNFEELNNLSLVGENSESFTRVWAPSWYSEGFKTYITVGCEYNNVFYMYVNEYDVITHNIVNVFKTNIPSNDYHFYYSNNKYYALGNGNLMYADRLLSKSYVTLRAGLHGDNIAVNEGDVAIQLDNGTYISYIALKMENSVNTGIAFYYINDISNSSPQTATEINITEKALVEQNLIGQKFTHPTIIDLGEDAKRASLISNLLKRIEALEQAL